MAQGESSPEKINTGGKFTLAGREIDSAIREVKWQGETALLEPKSLGVLVVLIGAEGRPVSRDELVEKIWDGAIVSDDAIHRTISKLRRGLFDNSREPEIIATIPKAGYRLLVAPEALGDPTVWKDSGVKRIVALTGFGAIITAAVFWMTMGGEPEIPAQNFDYAQARAITSSPGYEFAPVLSPNSGQLAYVSFDYDRPDPSLDLFLLDRETGVSKLIAGGPGNQTSPAWAPGGDALFYIDGVNGGCAIMAFSMEANASRKLAPCISAQDARLTTGSIDASYLLDEAEAGGKISLFSLDISNGVGTRIDFDAANIKDIVLSQDGKKLAFVRETAPERFDIYSMPLSTLEQKRLTKESRNIQGIAWAPNGNDLIISSDHAGLFRLWNLRSRDGRMSAIATAGMNASSPAIASDGDALIYQVWGSDINIQRFYHGDMQPGRLASSNRWEWSPAPSPDGSAIAFLTNRDGTTDLWIANIDGSDARRVAQFDGWFDTTLSWRPDGEAIALSTLTDARFSIVIVDTAGQEIQRLAHPTANLRDPAFSENGAAVFYASDEGGEQTIRMRNLKGGEEIITEGVLPRLSPAGDILYVAKADGSIDRLSLKTAATKEIISARRGGLLRAWTPTNDGVAFLGGSISNDYDLKHWNAATATITTLAGFDFEIHETSALAQDPDGGFWLTRIDQSGSDLWEAPGTE